MSKTPFDSTVKDLIEDDQLGWARHFNPRPVLSASAVDADASTVTAASDKVLLVVDAAGKRLLLFEPLTYHDPDAPRRVHLYATILHTRHGLTVRAVILLLRPGSGGKKLTGKYELKEPGESKPYETFRYQVVKVWEQPMAPLMTGGVGLLPLAALTNEASADLPAVVQRINARLRAETTPEVAGKMMTSMFVLLGLRHDAALIDQLYQGVQEMEESSTYQLLISRGEARGEVRGERNALLLVGRQKLGEPSADQLASIEGISERERLEKLLGALNAAKDWKALLETP